MTNDDYFKINENELMEYFHYSGFSGKLKLRFKFVKTWILHSMAYSSPLANWIISFQRMRGVKIGKNCHFSPYVQIDLLYPDQITIDDNVSIGTNCIIFAHANMPTNMKLKNNAYPRKINPVHIKSGAIIGPGTIITAGVTIGKNALTAVGSVVTQDVPDSCVAAGNPARVIKKIDE
tara:strand:+ start:399 stop:929 length:531 start_codon:yes stop_codon:yes gene_type:complete